MGAWEGSEPAKMSGSMNAASKRLSCGEWRAEAAEAPVGFLLQLDLYPHQCCRFLTRGHTRAGTGEAHCSGGELGAWAAK